MNERFVRVGVDVGDARVGIARSDSEGVLATPMLTALRDQAALTLQQIVTELGARRIYVGLPRSLSGAENKAARKVRDFIAEFVALPVIQGEPEYDIYLVDERFTTVSAHEALSMSGRKTKHHRSVVDQVAAVMILQSALDVERNHHRPAGLLWEPPTARSLGE